MSGRLSFEDGFDESSIDVDENGARNDVDEDDASPADQIEVDLETSRLRHQPLLGLEEKKKKKKRKTKNSLT